ncbi:MAG: co-chaperone GroES [Bryobacteraceae bacterium]
MKPIGDRVLVRPDRDEGEGLSAGGVVIPGTVERAPTTGVIVQVGPGREGRDGRRVAPEVSAGDRVIFAEGAGDAITVDGEDLLVMGEDDVVARIEAR